ncbi:NADH dehydrogenase (quinone), G subunit [Elsinoe australis]|uniref:NADH dehydrogenase (Quinone), G subunit n=1 Tax=Elsinoe australis TaxID=40998 RepID=A0A2P8AG91_9PEZI|nr:NADH dehydrogenase (quinone), G subunit [Elsinoe australis]
MLQRQLLRAARRPQRLSRFNASRTFATTIPRTAEVEIFVDDQPVKIEAGSALIQACEKAGKTIPRYCYHEKLVRSDAHEFPTINTRY